MRRGIEHLLRTADSPDPERAELLWAEYRTGGSGREGAFATLLAWYGGPLYRRIWGFVRSDAADDVFQTVVAELHHHRDRLPTFADALRWLQATADRRAADAHRRAVRRRHREARAALELQQALAVALARLPEELRRVIALHYFEGLDKQTAAATLGIHRDTFVKRLAEALERLRKLLPVAVVLAGPTERLEAALESGAPLLSAERLSELAATAAAASTRLGKWVAALVALAACGLAVASWTSAPPSASEPVARVTAAAVELETVPERNLRHFRAEVLPRQLTALAGLVPDGGGVELESVETFDSRIDCVYRLRLRPGGSGPGSAFRLRFLGDAASPGVRVFLDLGDDRRYRPINPDQPLILGRNPLTGATLAVRSAPLEAAITAFTGFPNDDLARAEEADHLRRLLAAFRRYEGKWYRLGEPGTICWVQVGDTGGRLIGPNRHPDFEMWRFRLLPDGPIVAPYEFANRVVELSADGRRIDFPLTGEWWSREPNPKDQPD
jgi:DNA-directed RNA polymerase specialized sigma24 family protein